MQGHVSAQIKVHYVSLFYLMMRHARPQNLCHDLGKAHVSLAAGQSSTESCLAFHRQLDFSIRLPACKRDVQEAWSGKILLLQCPHHQCSPNAVEDKGFDNQQAGTASAEALCESLQYSRLLGCLE